MKIIATYLIFNLVAMFIGGDALAQVLDADSTCNLKLSNKTQVTCYQSVTAYGDSNTYYYLPVNLRFSSNKKEAVEFSFMVYKNKDNQTEGAIMHWLMTWGLTKNQLKEASALLKLKKGKEAYLAGAVLPERIQGKEYCSIEGNSEIAKILRKAAGTIGMTPLLANTKTASSFKFSKSDANLIQKKLDERDGLKNISVSMYFNIQFKSVKTRIIKTKQYKLSQNLHYLLKYSL